MSKRAILLLAVLMLVPLYAGAGEALKRWASGRVVATDVASTPNTIVIKAKNWKGLEMVVGAELDAGTVITSRGKAITLGQVRVGDMVDMEYTRNKFVTARKIQVR